MTIPNHDHEIEKRAHPENFEVEQVVSEAERLLPESLKRVPRLKLSAKRGSAKEARTIAYKKRGQK